MDDKDVEILKVIYEKSHSALIAPLFLIEKFCVSDGFARKSHSARKV